MMIQKVIRFIKYTEYSLGVTQQKSMCLLLKVIKDRRVGNSVYLCFRWSTRLSIYDQGP